MKVLIAFIGFLGLATAAKAEQSIKLMTEQYAPFAFRDQDGRLRGSGIEQVEALMNNAGLDYKIEIVPWARAITMAETQPMHCVFTAAQTPERLPLFKWVLPLSISNSILVRHAQSDVRASSLDDAKRYTIGTHRADYTEDLLRRQGFPAIDLSADFQISINKLLEKRVDMVPMSESLLEKLRSEGKPLEAVIPFSQQQFGIACNKTMSDATIARMHAGLDRLIQTRGQDEILKRHGLKPMYLWRK